jgi:hypothetical protein
LNEGGHRTLDVGHATNGLAVEIRFGRGARRAKEAMLEGDEEERPMTIHVCKEAREPDRKFLFEGLGIARRLRQLSAKGFASLLEKSAQDVFFGPKVVVYGADRDPGALGDVLYSGRMKAAIGDDFFGRVENGVPKEGTRLVAPRWDGGSFDRTSIHDLDG